MGIDGGDLDMIDQFVFNGVQIFGAKVGNIDSWYDSGTIYKESCKILLCFLDFVSMVRG